MKPNTIKCNRSVNCFFFFHDIFGFLLDVFCVLIFLYCTSAFRSQLWCCFQKTLVSTYQPHNWKVTVYFKIRNRKLSKTCFMSKETTWNSICNEQGEGCRRKEDIINFLNSSSFKFGEIHNSSIKFQEHSTLYHSPFTLSTPSSAVEILYFL